MVWEAEGRLERHWRSKTVKLTFTRNVLEKRVALELQAGKHGTSEGVNKLIGRGMLYPVEA